jgi:nucleoside-diphosphate-sugar epimerase
VKRVVITGATGMIGIAFIKLCLQNSVSVIAIVRPNSLRIDRIPKSDLITIWECDLENLTGYNLPNDIMPFPDVFYHFGWTCNTTADHDLCDKQLQNVQYTLNAVRLARQLGCARFIGTGTQVEYGHACKPLNGTIPVDPVFAYGVAKYAAGKMSKIECEKLSLEHIWVRVLSVYGIYARDENLISSFIFNCKNNISMDLGPCTHIWDYLHVDDAARALFLIGEKKGINGKVYCLGSGIGKPLKDYIEIIKNIINPDYQPGYGKVPYNEKSYKYLCADISELTEDTGWRPEITFEEGIKRIIGKTQSAI